VIYVFRVGDSLERIATTYGLSLEQITQANGLGVNGIVAEGTPLVIPLPTPSRGRQDESAARKR
jgi:LysM repeat protein